MIGIDRRASPHLARRPIFPGWSGRCSRASSVPTSRSVATIRSANTSTTSPAMDVVKSVYVQTNWAKERFEDEIGLGAAHLRGNRLAACDRGLRGFRAWTTCARSSTGSSATRWCVACACNCTGTRTRSTASPRAPDLLRGPDGPPQHRAARRLRLELRSAGVRAADAGRGRTCRRSLSEGDVRAAARRNAGGSVAAGRSAWRGGMVRLAACRTSSASSQGLARSSIAMTLRTSSGIVAETVAIFGADRCLFGSNFPIEKLWTSYRDLDRRLSRRHRQRTSAIATRSCAIRRCGSIVSRPSLAPGKQTKGMGDKHGAGNQDSDYGDIELESSFLGARARLWAHAPCADAGLSHCRVANLSDRCRH